MGADAPPQPRLLVRRLRDYITLPAVQGAYDRFLECSAYRFEPVQSTKRVVQFFVKGTTDQPYAFIVAKRHLLFYVRALARPTWAPQRATLLERFGTDLNQAPNASGKEWTVKVRAGAVIEALERLAKTTGYPLR